MIDVAKSYDVYRRAYADLEQQGVETEGIWTPSEFGAAVRDTRTALLTVNGAVLPLATPIENLPYVNAEYYQALLPPDSSDAPVYYYSHLPPLMRGHGSDVEQVLRPVLRMLADRGGLVIYDTPETRAARTDEEFAALLMAIGGVAARELTNNELVHYQYESVAARVANTPRLPLDFPQLYRRVRATGAASSDAHIEVLATLNPSDAQHVWEYYDEAFQGLSRLDGIYAGYNELEFAEAMANPSFTKFVYRLGGNIVNMILAADETTCPQFNHAYFRSKYPQLAAESRIVYGVGAITDRLAPRPGPLALRTIRTLGELVGYAGGDVVITLVADVVSNQYLPKLADIALKNLGLGLDFSKPIGRQVFSAKQLQRL